LNLRFDQYTVVWC